ncbi:MAG: hypothetical protein IPP99_00025 [Chitinophagaceae bacterium]|nr:hypothetical protein [Chitinophagaceae bacterium]
MAGHYSIVDPHLSCLYSALKKLNHRLGRQQLHHRKQRHPGAEFSIHQKSFSPHTGYVMGNYHPITMISYAVEYKISKLDPKTYHTNNVLPAFNQWHSGLFIYLVAFRKNTGSFHHCGAFSTSSHACRKCCLDLRTKRFTLLSFRNGGFVHLHIVYTKEKSAYYILCFIFFILALLSKAMAVAMVGILPLLDFYFNRKLTRTKVILEKIPFLIVGVIAGLVAIQAQNEFEAIVTTVRPLYDRFLFAGYSFITYFWKSILPIQLSTFMIIQKPELIHGTSFSQSYHLRF